MRKKFPDLVYVTRVINEEGTEIEYTEYFIDTDKSFVLEEDEGTEVAVYQLFKVGAIKKSSRVVFE